jgi:hypothetical protein
VNEEVTLTLYGIFSLAAVAIVGLQTYHWLETGEWYPVPLSLGLDFVGLRVPTTDWIGLQIIVDWVLDLPLALVIWLSGVVGVPTLDAWVHHRRSHIKPDIERS